jgi:hypothetical protein
MDRNVIAIRNDGVHIVNKDQNDTILFECHFPRENFKSYVYTKDFNINVRVEHISKQLKNVKKKDIVTLFIEDGVNSKFLGISIKPDSKSSADRHEINYVSSYNDDDYIQIEVPEKECYNFPVTIDSSEFQKIKKLTTSVKKIEVAVQNNSVIFKGGGDGLNSIPSTMKFGDISNDKGLPVYSQMFNGANFDMIIKLPGLCSQIKFYAPKQEFEELYPLKIKMNASQNESLFGEIYVYIKNSHVIEEQIKENDKCGVVVKDVVKSTRGRRRKN